MKKEAESYKTLSLNQITLSLLTRPVQFTLRGYFKHSLATVYLESDQGKYM